MKISRNWLSDFVAFEDLSNEAFSELITTRVAEVDDVHTSADILETAVVAVIKKITPIAGKSNLTEVVLGTGGGDVTVVCGANNCAEGNLAAYVPPGGFIHKPGETESLISVTEREVGGVLSKGLLASSAELGLSADHNGIAVISAEMVAQSVPLGQSAAMPNFALGTSLSEFFDSSDVVLEIDNKSLTHRPDLWSHFGFAREIAAILGRPFKFNPDNWADDDDSGSAIFQAIGEGISNFTVRIEPNSGCRRFAALELENLEPTNSPLWLQRRLISVGAGVRNLLVDLSNYVMHDVGQPNHTYDADKLNGSIICIRSANDREAFRGLDGSDRQLLPSDIAVCDEAGVVALGGVIGGEGSAVSADTTRILLESGNWDPDRIRTTTKNHQVRTDASNRFEKSQSPYGVPLAIQRYTELLIRLKQSPRVIGTVSDVYLERPRTISVPFRRDYIRERIGAAIEDERIEGILTSMGFVERLDSDGNSELTVPYYRATRDINIEDDLVEEVGRIFGYENVPEQAPLIESSASKTGLLPQTENLFNDILSAQGFSEVQNYSFMGSAFAEELGFSLAEAVEIKNPVDSNNNVVRLSLLPGLIRCVQNNVRYNDRCLLYELGRSYSTEFSAAHADFAFRDPVRNAAAFERRLLSIAYASALDEKVSGLTSTPQVESGTNFYALANLLRQLAARVGVSQISFSPISSVDEVVASAAHNFLAQKRWMHPFRMSTVLVAGTPVGIIAEVNPTCGLEVPKRTVLAEIDIELLLAGRDKEKPYETISKFPDSFFEMSVVMPEREPYQQLELLLHANVESQLLRKIEVASVYRGKPLADDEKSISVKLFLGADDRTLSGDELSSIQDHLIQAVEVSPYSLRA